jgi:Fe-S cluster assembly protein SufD
MELLTNEARAARSQLAARGWVDRKSESFRHLPPPAAALWLGDESCLAPWDAVEALADGWSLQALPGTDEDAVEVRWLDVAQPADRAQLHAALPTAVEDEAAPFAWAHRALNRQALRVRIAARRTASLRITRHACRAVEAPLLVVELAAGARCVLLETHERQDARPAVQNLRVQVRLAAGANLQHLRHVAPSAEDRVAHHLDVRLERDAAYAQSLLANGSNYHLQRNSFDLKGERAWAAAGGVLLAAGSALEQQVLARHGAANTRSAAEMLALASGGARVVAHANTYIGAGCDDAETRQRLSGIPTGGQPRLVLRPHLEIHHDQVQAAHGATWGALPEEALFHARQRGLDERAAKALILEGLARSVLARTGGELVETELDAALAQAVARHLGCEQESRHG